MTIDIPATATVFAVAGLGGSIDSQWLNGIFDTPAYRFVKVDYPASMATNAITIGVAMVYDLVKRTSGDIVLLGHSEGSLVLSEFIRIYNGDHSLPGTLTFVLTGNEVRNPTGAQVGGAVIGPLGSKGVATPNNSRWPVYDVARKGDAWAIRNNNVFKSWLGKLFTHPFYKGVDLFSPDNVVTRNGNIVLVTTP